MLLRIVYNLYYDTTFKEYGKKLTSTDIFEKRRVSIPKLKFKQQFSWKVQERLPNNKIMKEKINFHVVYFNFLF